jgi:hypothetical protein
MDQVSTGGTSRDTVRARRKRMRMRTEARSLRRAAAPNGFETPEWLDHSFVLPLTEPEVSDVPSQSVPHHDDFRAPHPAEVSTPETGTAARAFVRPPTPEIDFARVIRRSDLSRTASRAILGATGLAGLSLIAFLLTSSQILLGMAIAFIVVTLVAAGVRLRLATASIPHLDR